MRSCTVDGQTEGMVLAAIYQGTPDDAVLLLVSRDGAGEDLPGRRLMLGRPR
jgi:hypothetical protein